MNVLDEAIKTFGKESQCRMAIEEMSELTKEICKNLRGADNKVKIAEEMADVLIMLAQLEIIFDCTEKKEDWVKFKIERLALMLKEGKK